MKKNIKRFKRDTLMFFGSFIVSFMIFLGVIIPFFDKRYNQQYIYNVEEEAIPLGEPWRDGDWSYCKLVTIDYTNVGDTLVNFPILFDNTSSDFIKAQSDGDDFMFVSYDNSTQYNHEIERFNNSGDNRLIAWVNIPVLSGISNTQLWLYYGNPTCSSQENKIGTWNSNYLAVYHLKDATTSTVSDSTSYARTGTKGSANTPIESVYGKIVYCQNYSGFSPHYITGSTISASPTGSYTFEAIFKTSNHTKNKALIVQGDHNNNNEFGMSLTNYDASGGSYKDNISMSCSRYPGTSTIITSTSSCLQGNDWVYASCTYNNGAMKIFVNGTEEKSGTYGDKSNCTTGDQLLGIGVFTRNTGYSDYWYGSFDEARVSNTAHNVSWLKTTYNTTFLSSTFLTVGDEETISGWVNSNPVNANPSPANNAINVDIPPSDFSIYVSDSNGDIMNISWYTNESGSWNLAQTNSSVTNGTYHLMNKTWVDSYFTTYWWNVSTNDGMGGWDNDTYSFTTKSDVTKYSGNPVINKGNSGKWDDTAIESISVLYYNGSYHLWYEGYGGTVWGIGLANSTDGITWTKDATDDGRVLQHPTASQENTGYADPNVRVINDVYYLWCLEQNTTGSGWVLCRFNSTDGVNWGGKTYCNTPSNSVYEHYMDVSGGYNDIKMYYADNGGTNYIWSRNSTDGGITWSNANTVYGKYAGDIQDYSPAVYQLINDTYIMLLTIQRTSGILEQYYFWCSNTSYPPFFNGAGIKLVPAGTSGQWDNPWTLDGRLINSSGGSNTTIVYAGGASFAESTGLAFWNITDIIYNHLVYSVSPPPGGWWNYNWSYYKVVTINYTKVGDILLNFPVLINITDTDLKNYAQSDGDDIVFISIDNNTKYDHEIEYYDSSTGHLVAWVKIPIVYGSTDTHFLMYFNNSGCSSQQNVSSVWDSNFKNIQHLKDKTTSSTEDSTNNNYDGTKAAADTPSEINGQIYKGQDFDSGSEHIVFGDVCDMTGAFTLEAWIKAQDNGAATAAIIYKYHNLYGYQLNVEADTGKLIFIAIAGSLTGTYSITGNTVVCDDNWRYITAVRGSDNKLYLYLDGVSDATSVTLSNPGDQSTDYSLCIGNDNYDTSDFLGIIDEARLSNIARNYSWIYTTYNTTSSPSTFMSFGPIVSSDISPPVPPYNIEGVIYDSYLNITWTIGTGADTTMVRKKSGGYPTGVTDGTQCQNNTLSYWNETAVEGTYYSLWSYNVTRNMYSTQVNYTYGGLLVNCYDANTSLNITNWDILVSNSNGSEVYSRVNNNNTLEIDISECPQGLDTIIVNHTNYSSAVYYMTIYNGNWYTLDAYLTHVNYSEIFIIQVLDDYNLPVNNALVTIKKYINTTDVFETVSSIYTDGYGEIEVFLLPGTLYKVFIEKTGYTTLIADYIPDINIRTKIFKITLVTTTPPSYDSFYTNISFNSLMTGPSYMELGNITTTYNDKNSSTVDTDIYIFSYYNGTYTLLASYHNTSNNFTIVTGSINTTRLHKIVLYFNNSADFIDVDSPLTIVIDALYVYTNDTGYEKFDFDERVTNVFGPFTINGNAVPWPDVIAFSLGIAVLLLFGPLHVGIALIGCGLMTGFVNALFSIYITNAFPILLVSLAPIFIVLGTIHIMSKGGREHI